jgi:hypothetical protein
MVSTVFNAYPKAVIFGFFSSAFPKLAKSKAQSSMLKSTWLMLQPLSSATNSQGIYWQHG